MDSDQEPQRTGARRSLRRPIFRDRSGANRPSSRLQETLFPLTMTEIERLAINGVNKSSLIFLQKVLKQHSILFTLLVLTIYGWIAIMIFYPGLLRNDPSVLFVSIALPACLAIGLTEWWFWRPLIRERMALNLIILVRLLMKWDNQFVRESKLTERYSAASKSQKFIVPYTRRLAWSFSRDIAVMCGQPSKCGSVEPWCCVGQAIAWCGERMFDPRRRAMLWELVSLLAEFFADEVPGRPPPLIVTAATQVKVRPTKPVQLLFAGRALRNPIAVGVIVALVTAIVRLWLGK